MPPRYEVLVKGNWLKKTILTVKTTDRQNDSTDSLQ